MVKLRTAQIELSEEELEVLIFILDDWQTMKSDGSIPVEYPNKSTTSTKLIAFLNEVFKSL